DGYYYQNDSDYVEGVIFKNFDKDEIAGSSILDFGCGSGDASRVFARNGCKDVLGIDIGQENIRHARQICQELQSASFLISDLNSHQLETSRYDLIWSDTTIELLQKPLAEIVQDLNAALVSGGKLYLSFTEDTVFNRLLYLVLAAIKACRCQKPFEKVVFYLVKMRYGLAGKQFDEENIRNKLKYLWIPFVRLISERQIKNVLLQGGFQIQYIRKRDKSDINSPPHLELKAVKG
uniref:class I SAM-dependent methyltransferase n=1 Tax=Gimesia sp. TaxID=2024833 RepID=UPI003A9475FA